MHNYVLITPARNEEKYIAHTIQSIIAQTVQPLAWIIVSDNSIDKTDEIVNEYVNRYPFIKLIRVVSEKKRNFGAQVRAFLKGYELIKDLQYDFIGNLDADVSFERDYYKKVIGQFALDNKLGLAGGFIFEKQNGVFRCRKHNSTDSVAHAVQLFRRECFLKINGYVPLRYGGSDSVAETKVRMNGWNVKAFPWLEVYHHKPTLGAEGKYNGAFRQGLMDYSIGIPSFFELLRCLIRASDSPIYSVCRYTGFIWAIIKRNPREVDVDTIRFLKKEQKRKFISTMERVFISKSQPKASTQ